MLDSEILYLYFINPFYDRSHENKKVTLTVNVPSK